MEKNKRVVEGDNTKVNKKAIILNILHIIFLLILSILLVASFYVKKEFANESIEEMIFYISHGVQEAGSDVVTSASLDCLLYVVFVFSAFMFIFYGYKFISKMNIIKKHKAIITTAVAIVSLCLSFHNVQGFVYLKVNLLSSNYIEKNYVEPSVTFNEKKRNLIMIYVESLETTFFTKEQGGDFDHEVMPELYNLLYDKDSVFFSATDKASGISNIYGTTWTTASLVSSTTGLPFKVNGKRNSYNDDKFLDGTISMGDILYDNGYYNEVISASKTSFGGLKEFYTRHGNYEIIDVDTLDKYGYKLEKNNKSDWGFNDKFMYEIAKERLTEISKKDQPFSETLISIDTHFPDGYKGDYTLNKYSTQYENVYATESKLLGDFINWIKEQEFYKDTTIVIMGDHLNMQTEYFKKYDQNKRKRYNVIINSVAKYDKKNTQNRKFTALDIAPTVFVSMGANVKDDKYGLGVNLYSGEKTIIEKDDVNKLNMELAYKSKFYNKEILKEK